MFAIYDYAERMNAIKLMPSMPHLPIPAHLEFIALAQSGALGFTTQQICSAKPFGGVFFNRNHESK
jgi:hypothetical protein